MNNCIKDMAKTIRDLSYKHNTYEVFADFAEMSAISIHNSVMYHLCKERWEKDEAQYMQIVKRYDKKELDQMPKLLGMLTNGLEVGFDDILGGLFHELELHNEHRGQFFTPYSLCKMIALLTSDHEEIIKRKRFITASEPACGSGAMIIALAETMHEKEINYQEHMHVTAVDIDSRCVNMAYTQLSLLGIPAVVVQGNTITLEETKHWYTPAHFMGNWDQKLKTARMVDRMREFLTSPPQEEEQPAPQEFVKPDIDLSKPAQQLTMF